MKPDVSRPESLGSARNLAASGKPSEELQRSFRLSLPKGSQLRLDRLPELPAVVQAGLNNPAYGRPEENSMTLLNIQPDSTARPLEEGISLSTPGRYTAATLMRFRWSSSDGACVLLKSNWLLKSMPSSMMLFAKV